MSLPYPHDASRRISGGVPAHRRRRPRARRPHPTGTRSNGPGTMPPSGDGNGFGDALRRGLRALRAVRAHPSPALDRVGAHRTRGRPARHPRHRALPRGAHRGARRRRLAVGLPAPLHAAGLVHRDRRGRLRRRPRPLVLLGPPRRVLRGDVRRPRVRLEADQRARRVRGHLPARARSASTCSARSCSRSATRGASCAAAASRSRRSTTSRRCSPSRTRSRRPDAGQARGDDLGRVDARRSRRRVGAARAGRRVEVPDLREACDIVGFSYYTRDGRRRRRRDRAVPDRGAGRPDGLRAVERRARRSCCTGCTTSCPGGRC